MNFDPYDSAAWRTFNMLDDDESALFDEAMRHDPALRGAYLEMDRLAAAIAATTALPIEPKAGQLERLQTRLGLIRSQRSHLWLGVSGWAAAAVLAFILILHLTGIIDRWGSATPAIANPSPHPHDPAATPPTDASHTPAQVGPDDVQSPAVAAVTGKDTPPKTTIKVETKRLNQEIEVLRENLEKFQHRDRVLFEVVPGMALPIVMSMNPPGIALEDSPTLARNDAHSPLTALLGNVLTELTGASAGTSAGASAPSIVHTPDTEWLPNHPTAIPIYDAARDSGTLVVCNLPLAAVDEVYNLWVTTESGSNPVYVGTLPESSAQGADSFDFSLGSTMVLPSGFILTIDPQDAPATPTASNTVLQGPPMPAR